MAGVDRHLQRLPGTGHITVTDAEHPETDTGQRAVLRVTGLDAVVPVIALALKLTDDVEDVHTELSHQLGGWSNQQFNIPSAATATGAAPPTEPAS